MTVCFTVHAKFITVNLGPTFSLQLLLKTTEAGQVSQTDNRLQTNADYRFFQIPVTEIPDRIFIGLRHFFEWGFFNPINPGNILINPTTLPRKPMWPVR